MSLERWVNDELHDVLGFSDKLTVEFLIASAKKSSSLDKFLGSLGDLDIDVRNSKVTTFATKLYDKVTNILILVFIINKGIMASCS